MHRGIVKRGDAMTNVLFVCIGNQGRSLIAERLFRAAAGDEHEARSAGARPGAEAHPEVLAVLREIGIDASDHVPRQLDDELIDWADVVVAACDGACPVTPGKRGWTGTSAIRSISRSPRCVRSARRSEAESTS